MQSTIHPTSSIVTIFLMTFVFFIILISFYLKFFVNVLYAAHRKLIQHIIDMPPYIKYNFR